MTTSFTTASTTIGTTCTNYAGGQVTITVPSSGTIMVQAQVWARINHASGVEDLAFLMVGYAPIDCSGGPGHWPIDVPAAVGNAIVNMGGFPQNAFVVTAGTYTFYLNGFMTSGADPLDQFYFGNMAAVFYPS